MNCLNKFLFNCVVLSEIRILYKKIENIMLSTCCLDWKKYNLLYIITWNMEDILCFINYLFDWLHSQKYHNNLACIPVFAFYESHITQQRQKFSSQLQSHLYI